MAWIALGTNEGAAVHDVKRYRGGRGGGGALAVGGDGVGDVVLIQAVAPS